MQSKHLRITIKQFNIASYSQDMSSNMNLGNINQSVPFTRIFGLKRKYSFTWRTLVMFHYFFAQPYMRKVTRNIQTAVYWCGVDAAECRVSGGRTEAEVIAAAQVAGHPLALN